MLFPNMLSTLEREPMQALVGERILTAWEHGIECREPCRALALLATALPGSDAATLASLPLAERNALLMRLRTLTFGASIEGFAVCPECGAQLEFKLNAHDLEQAQSAPHEETWFEHGASMKMRPANSNDMAALVDACNEEEARKLLLSRVMELPELDCASTESTEWIARFERMNAPAEIRCTLQCSACGARPVLDLDIAGFLWREVAVAARRLLAEIHTLARAYGWSEQSIVAMSAKRRSAYLEILEA